MGGSTNTVLHILAAAQEAGVDFTMSDIDAISRKVPCLCRWHRPSGLSHRGCPSGRGIMGILGELLIRPVSSTGMCRPFYRDPRPAIDRWDVVREHDLSIHDFYKAALAVCPGSFLPGSPLQRVGSRSYPRLHPQRRQCLFLEGGLAVLHGNIAIDGCIVKTAGVDESIWKFNGTARVYESQDAAVEGILGGEVVAGDVVVIRYEGPKGGPGMQGDALSDLLPEIARSG